MFSVNIEQLYKSFQIKIKNDYVEETFKLCGLKSLYNNINNKCDNPTEQVIKKCWNAEILEEVKLLFEMAEKIAIEIILLKGLSEAYDLYPNPDYRISSDIDLLIRPCDAVKFSLACKEMGYKYGDKEITVDAIKTDLSYKANHHINKFIKKKTLFSIALELHVVFDISWYTMQRYNGNNLTETIFLHKHPLMIDGSIINVCDIYDRLIFAMQHCARHIYSCIGTIGFYEKRQYIDFNFKTLVDGILIYNKYSEKINEDILYERIELYGFSGDLLLANKICTEIFDVTPFDDKRLKQLKPYIFNYWKDHISECLVSQIEFKELMAGKYFEINKKIVEKCLMQNEQYNCRYDCNDEIIKINESLDSLTRKRFSTVCRYNLIPKVDNDFHGEIIMHHDDKKLYIEFNIADSVVMVKGPGRQNKWTESISILIYNPNCDKDTSNITTGIFMTPEIKENGEYKVKVQYTGEWRDKRSSQPYPQEGYEASFIITNNGYKLSLQLTWDKLGIDYSNLDYLGMDFVLNNVDTNEPKLDGVLCWSNPITDFYNPTTFGLVKFIK